MNNTITIVGCGFIGSHISNEFPKLLRSQNLFDINFKLIDFDTWEDRNSANQHVSFREASKQKYKSKTCARYIKQYGYEAEAITEKLTPYNAKDLLSNSFLVIDCVDNIPSRRLMWVFATQGQSGACMHLGMSRKGEGIINWSSKNFCTFPFTIDGSTRELPEQDIHELPCEMYKYRADGTILFNAAAKAFSFFMGLDPWKIISESGTIEPGTMTCWFTGAGSSRILTSPEDIYLTEEGFPVSTNFN